MKDSEVKVTQKKREGGAEVISRKRGECEGKKSQRFQARAQRRPSQSRKDDGTNKQMGEQGEKRDRKQQRRLYCKNQCGIPFCSCPPVCQCMCLIGFLPVWHIFRNPHEA